MNEKSEAIFQLLCSHEEANQLLGVQLAHSQLSKAERIALSEEWLDFFCGRKDYKTYFLYPIPFRYKESNYLHAIGILSDSMERLYIKNIQHSKLPASFSFLKKLKELHLDGLDLTDKGTDFSNFKELQKLKISSCKIDSTVIFSGLKKLETLYLTYGLNKIVEIGSLTNLKSLTLFESKITDWKEGFKSLSELKKIERTEYYQYKMQ